MLQAVFHPRINYAEAVARVRKPTPTPTSTPPVEAPKPVPKEPSVDKRTTTGEVPTVVTPKSTTSIPKVTLPLADDDDDAPIPEVPRLKKAEDNGKASTEKKEEKPTDEPR